MYSTAVRTVALALCSAALLAAGSAPLSGQGKDKDKGKDKEKPKDKPAAFAFPLKAGSVWEYRAGKEKVSVRVAKEEPGEKETRAVLESSAGDKKGAKTSTETLALREDGVYRLSADGADITPALCILKLPYEAAATWPYKSAAGPLPVSGNFVAEEEEVAVPAGKFKAVRVSSADFRIGQTAIPLTYWFVSDVGLVKQRLVVGGREVVLELEKYTPAK